MLRAHYMHGWGVECVDARPIVCSWSLTIMNIKNWPVTISFDLVNGSSGLKQGQGCWFTTNIARITKKTESIRATVVSTGAHIVVCRRKEK